ncbi:hypothetical protein NX059_003829 [Plenodomus lindquistii]|nr:hypothetical protein NX059_003829 [Plenodomus lindquistii]
MSIVDPSAPKTSTVSKPVAPAGVPRPVSRPVGGANGASQSPQLKRKASGPVESTQAKVQRKETASQTTANGAVRATSTPAAVRTTTVQTTTVPYRGTAAPSSNKPANTAVRKPLTPASAPAAAPKAVAPAPKSAPAPAGAGPASATAPKKGYLALLQKAKEKDATKPAAPPIKHEPTKILTKKERLALKAEASGAKGKKSVPGVPPKAVDPKADASKRKPTEVGYQGTARPAKKPIEVGYKGTARPASAPASSSRNGTPAVKAKPAPGKGRYDGYADWDDLDDMDDEEDDYASDASSDMEGGIWDVEQEEQLALKAAKKEDAEALAEEMRLKREKDARKQKLMAMSKAAAAKRKF